MTDSAADLLAGRHNSLDWGEPLYTGGLRSAGADHPIQHYLLQEIPCLLQQGGVGAEQCGTMTTTWHIRRIGSDLKP